MDSIKQISASAIPSALAKAERYRLLNEPVEAESICLDILAIDPGNQEARVMLILTLTDQVHERLDAYDDAKDAIAQLETEYERAYYRGINQERRARAHQRRGTPGSGHVAYDWFHRALESFEQAHALRPDGNDEAVFRSNSILRTLERDNALQPAPDDPAPQLLE